MLYVITPSGVTSGKTLNQINKKLKAKFDENEFTQLGADKITKINTDDVEFVQDKKRLSMIPMSSLYKADNSKYYLIGILILQMILLLKK